MRFYTNGFLGRRGLRSAACLLLPLWLGAGAALAATISWKGGGGDWNTAANWSPAQIPGPGDTAVISSGGTYTVTLGNSVEIARLQLGGGTAQPTLAVGAVTLQLDAGGTVGTNAALNFSGTTLAGSLTMNGSMTWAGGELYGYASLSVATNGVLNLDGSMQVAGVLTNAGTVSWTGGSVTIYNYPPYGDNGGIVNLAGGVFNVGTDASLDTAYGDEYFINAGVVRKTVTHGNTIFYPAFYNTGTLDAETGTLTIYSGGSGNGQFAAGGGGALTFTAGYTVGNGAAFTGPGAKTLNGGNYIFNGAIFATNLILATGTLSGNNTLNGTMTWTGGTVAGNSTMNGTMTWSGGELYGYASLSVATNGVLNLDGSMQVAGVLTNAGTVSWTGGSVTIYNYPPYGDNGGIVNLAGGVFNVGTDASLDTAYGDEYFINAGVVRKTVTHGNTIFYPAFYNTGTLDAETGTLTIYSGGSGNGLFAASGGGALTFTAGYTVGNGAAFTGPGAKTLNGGNYIFNGAIFATNLILATGTLSGNNTLNGTMTWTGGTVAGNSTMNGTMTWAGGELYGYASLTVATNGVLNLDGSMQVAGVLTNAGTVYWTGGSVTIYNYPPYGDNGGIVNLAGGVFNVETDASLDTAYGDEYFINAGVVRKTVTHGNTVIYPFFINSGTLDTESGTLTFYVGGVFNTGTMIFGLNGPGNNGQVVLPGSATLGGLLGAHLNGGYRPVVGNSFTLITAGSVGGEFASTSLPGGNSDWREDYGSTFVNLVLTNPLPPPGSINLVSSENPAGKGDSVAFTALLQNNATGSVLFLTNGVPFDTVALADGVGTSAATTLLPTGTNLVTAVYSGDDNYLGVATNLYQVVTNHFPVAQPMAVTRTAGLTVKIALSDLATNWSDPDGYPVALTAVNLTSANGLHVYPLNLETNPDGSYVITNTAFLGYVNPANVNDQIYYTISDSQGDTTTGVINVVVSTSPLFGQTTGIVNPTGNAVTLNFAGDPGYRYHVQRSLDLMSWSTIWTTNAPPAGPFQYTDTFGDLGGTIPDAAYYRLEWNPQ